VVSIIHQTGECSSRRTRAHFNRAEVESTLSDADAALKRGPSNADAKLVRAEALVTLRRWDDALGAATEAYLSAQHFTREASTSLSLLQVIQRAKSAPGDVAAKSSLLPEAGWVCLD
jgi:hypothetical protein